MESQRLARIPVQIGVSCRELYPKTGRPASETVGGSARPSGAQVGLTRCGIQCILSPLPWAAEILNKPEWRNWQTRTTQTRVGLAHVGSIPTSGICPIKDICPNKGTCPVKDNQTASSRTTPNSERAARGGAARRAGGGSGCLLLTPRPAGGRRRRGARSRRRPDTRTPARAAPKQNCSSARSSASAIAACPICS